MGYHARKQPTITCCYNTHHAATPCRCTDSWQGEGTLENKRVGGGANASYCQNSQETCCQRYNNLTYYRGATAAAAAHAVLPVLLKVRQLLLLRLLLLLLLLLLRQPVHPGVCQQLLYCWSLLWVFVQRLHHEADSIIRQA
jgi:hypothetical protein